MSADVDWPRIAFEATASLVSAVGGLLVGAWQYGRRSAKREHAIKDDYQAQIEAVHMELSTAMHGIEQENAERLRMLVDQFQEAFAGLRRQIDDSRLHTETNFLRKDAFREFRDEYREDMRDLKIKIDELPQRVK